MLTTLKLQAGSELLPRRPRLAVLNGAMPHIIQYVAAMQVPTSTLQAPPVQSLSRFVRFDILAPALI
jgi:hypothetical protein